MSDSPTFIVRGDDGEEYGPVGLAELREWVRENRAGLGTQVCLSDGPIRWQAWQQFPELVALLAEVRATGRMMPPLPDAVPVLAPMGRRSMALLLDLVLAFLLVAPVFLVLYWLQPVPAIVAQLEPYYASILEGAPPPQTTAALTRECVVGGNVAGFLIPLFYFAGFQVAHGRTPAKSMLRLRVVDAQGRQPTLAMALLRGLVLMISVNLYGLPLIYAFFNPQRRALHDIVAGTYVVER
jgi:uncharacterized RDD family membrane protein YckC